VLLGQAKEVEIVKDAEMLADVGLFEFRRQIGYKGLWHGCELRFADRWYPSSKLCSQCGVMHPDLKLSDRIYKCQSCDAEMDRDWNAAENLAAYTVSSSGIYAFGERSSGSTLSVG
jgi:putative transposase